MIYLATHLGNFHRRISGTFISGTFTEAGPLSPKRLRARQSFYNADRVAAAVGAVFHLGVAENEGRGLPAWSAAILREWIEGYSNFDLVDRRAKSWGDCVARVPTEERPNYLLKKDPGAGFTRCGNVCFTEVFGDWLPAISLSPDAEGA